MGSIITRKDGRQVIQWIDGTGRQRQESLKLRGLDGKPLSKRAAGQEGRRRLGEPGAVEGLPLNPTNGTDGLASAEQVAADLRRTEYLRPEDLLPVKLVAGRLGLSPATVHNDINAGRLRYVLFGSVRRVRLEDFEKYAQARGVSSRAPVMSAPG